MKLRKTVLSRELCLKHYSGYTEYNNERLALRYNEGTTKDSKESIGPYLAGNHIIFAYEYDANGAQTGFRSEIVLQALRANNIIPIIEHQTFGGYVNAEGMTIEECGYLLTFDNSIDPVALGALAHKIAEMFRQQSVLVIYKDEVTFVNV